MSRTISSLNAPWTVESPIMIVGCTWPTTCARSIWPAAERGQSATAEAGWAYTA